MSCGCALCRAVKLCHFVASLTGTVYVISIRNVLPIPLLPFFVFCFIGDILTESGILPVCVVVTARVCLQLVSINYMHYLQMAASTSHQFPFCSVFTTHSLHQYHSGRVQCLPFHNASCWEEEGVTLCFFFLTLLQCYRRFTLFPQ